MELIKQLLVLAYTLHNMNPTSFIHNDIKTGNIVMYKDKPFLIDFEMCKPFNGRDENDEDICTYSSFEYGFTKVMSRAGTNHYNAPEKSANSNSYISPKTDVYSLGLVILGVLNKTPVTNTIWKSMSEDETRNICGDEVLVRMIQGMMKTDIKERLTISDCLDMLNVVSCKIYNPISHLTQPREEYTPKKRKIPLIILSEEPSPKQSKLLQNNEDETQNQ